MRPLEPALLAFGLALGGAALESMTRAGHAVTPEGVLRLVIATGLLGIVGARFLGRRRPLTRSCEE